MPADTPRIHIATRPPIASGKARGLCGLWSALFTFDPAAATCLRCRGHAATTPAEGTGSQLRAKDDYA